MHRRDFMRAGAVAGLSALQLRCGSPARPGPGAGKAAFALEEWTIGQLEQAMASSKLTARSIAEQYLARIEAVDRGDAGLASIIEVNPEAMASADERDRERRENRRRGPLHGVPIVVKDNIDTGDRMMTTAGSLALVGSAAARDAFVVDRLRAAGAVVLGKTNLSEWANFRSSRSVSGWSARGGQCRNPYDRTRSPCGSSSGSGAAIAANLCAAAIGTETDGSIVCPAAITGLVGIKPTVGLVSRAGIIPIAHSQDTAGPMARTVADAALLLTAIAGADDADAATAAVRGKPAVDYTRALDPRALAGARLGVARKAFGFNDRVDQIMERALAAIKQQGAVLVELPDLDAGRELNEAELLVLLYEFKANLAIYLAKRPPAVATRSLAQVIEFNERNRDREMRLFGQELFHQAQAKGPLTSKEYVDALALCQRLSRAEGIDKVMDAHQLDAIVAPTNGPAWKIDEANGDHYVGGTSTLPAIAGYPHVTVPAGFAFELPIGLSFYGRAWSEAKLIGIAHSFEQVAKARRPPVLT